MPHIANRSFGHHLRRFLQGRYVAIAEVDHVDDTRLGRRIGHGLRLGFGCGEGLFAQDMLAR